MTALRSFVDCQPGLERLARAYGVSDAEDVVQDAFLVFERRRAEVTPGAERAFLASTVRRIAARVRHRTTRMIVTEDIEVEDTCNDAEDRLDSARERALFDDALAALPDDLRETFRLCEIERFTKLEVAAILAVPAGTVASRRARAREIVMEDMRRGVLTKRLPCTGARADLFVAGRAWYEEHGLWERYRWSLPSALREDWSTLASADWVPLDTAMVLYGASSALALPADVEISLGRRIFGSVIGRVLAPSWAPVVRSASHLWRQAFAGGDVEIRIVDESAELELRAPMFRFAFFRNCIVGAVAEALEGRGVCALRIKSETSRSMRLSIDGRRPSTNPRSRRCEPAFPA